MLYILGSSLVVLTAAATKIRVEDNSQFVLNTSVALAQPAPRIYLCPRGLCSQRKKNFMCRSCACCLAINVLLSIEILPPSSTLIMPFRSRAGG